MHGCGIPKPMAFYSEGGPQTMTSLESLFEMQILRLQPRLTESDLNLTGFPKEFIHKV